MSYIGIPPFGNTVRSVTNVTATASQTTFNITGGYVIGYVDVFLNGVLLTPSDYTASNGLTVVLNTGASASDEFQAVSYQPVSIANVLPITGGTVSGDVTIASGNTLKTNVILDASGGNTVTINSVTPTAYNTMGKNRIINGAMEIDQRNAGASVTPTTSGYTLDRWQATLAAASKFSVQQSSTAPTGFKNSLLVTSLATTTVGSFDYYLIQQKIEGYNMSDFDWGTANAKTVTLSFWVRSSLTGTFGGSLGNNAFNRTYPFTYTISSANTWEQKSITIAGDTSGTWLSTNGTGIQLTFGLGSGSTFSGTAGAWAGAGYQTATGATQIVATNGATFYLTGVQLELGSTATEFERRPYGTELMLCERYYQVQGKPPDGSSWSYKDMPSKSVIAATALDGAAFRTTMRTDPTVVLYSRNGTSGKVSSVNTGSDEGNNWTISAAGTHGFHIVQRDAGSNTAGTGYEYGFTASAEL